MTALLFAAERQAQGRIENSAPNAADGLRYRAASHLFSYRRIFAGVTAQRESLSERVLVVPEPLLPVLEPLLFVPEPVVPRSMPLPVVLEPLLPVPEVPMPCISRVVTRENSSLLSLPSLSVSSLRKTSASLLLVMPLVLADAEVVDPAVPDGEALVPLVPEVPVSEEPGLFVLEDDWAEALMAAAARRENAMQSLAFMVMDGVVFGLEPSCDGAGFRPSLAAWLCGLSLADGQARPQPVS
jgi:hypothetical protein